MSFLTLFLNTAAPACFVRVGRINIHSKEGEQRGELWVQFFCYIGPTKVMNDRVFTSLDIDSIITLSGNFLKIDTFYSVIYIVFILLF